MPPFLKQLDLFEVPLPAFNLRGQESIRTSAGGIVSLVIMLVTFMFASIKMMHLLSRYNPNVSYFVMQDNFEPDYEFNFADENFMFAFALEEVFTDELKDDTRFVKYFVTYGTYAPDMPTVKELPIYPCREEDYAKFFPVEKKSAGRLEAIKTTPGRKLYCIDWEKVPDIFEGTERAGNYGVLDIEIMVLPCNMRLKHLGGVEDRIDQNCVADLNRQIEYLGPMNWIVYSNQ